MGRVNIILQETEKNNLKMNTITIWECQDCGKLYAKKEECWCCIDDEGEYTGKHGHYEIKCLGTYTTKQIKSLRPFYKAKKL